MKKRQQNSPSHLHKNYNWEQYFNKTKQETLPRFNALALLDLFIFLSEGLDVDECSSFKSSWQSVSVSLFCKYIQDFRGSSNLIHQEDEK